MLSFEELFQDLGKYIKDPYRRYESRLSDIIIYLRWKECVRVKRGIADTSQEGGMYKDQVILDNYIINIKFPGLS